MNKEILTPTKAELYQRYSMFPRRQLRSIINDIIKRFGRKKYVNCLTPKEYRAFLEEMEGVEVVEE